VAGTFRGAGAGHWSLFPGNLFLWDRPGARGSLEGNPSKEAVVAEPDVASVMTTRLVTARPETPFKDLVLLMSERGVSGVPVLDEHGRPVGVVTEADALAKQEFHGGGDEQPHHDPPTRDRWFRALARTAGELMTSPVRTIAAGRPVSVAARLLATEHVRRLFVVDDDGRLLGVVSRRDVLRVYARTDDELRADIEALLAAPPFDLPTGAVGVAVHDGVATVDGQLAGRRADVVARAVLAMPGVVGVRNNLRGGRDVGTDG
jgi:CBS domain-containing protein